MEGRVRLSTTHVQTSKGQESRRLQVYEYIKANPGAHLRKIKRELNLAMGVVQYHINRLEKDGVIISQRRGLYKRFYPRLGLGNDEREILEVLSQETERDILLYVIKHPNSNQKDISNFMQISPASTSWHMKRLSRTGILWAKRDGGSILYTVRGEPAKILTLLKSYHPAIWDKWAERLAELITG